MTSIAAATADLFTAGSVLLTVLALAATRELRVSVLVGLDLLLAAGLLRLVEPPSAQRLASVAAIIAIRQVVVLRWAALRTLRTRTPEQRSTM